MGFDDNDRTRMDAFGLLTGQVGYAWDKVLFYVKGGAAVTSNRFAKYDIPSGQMLDSANQTRWGGTVGAGVEYYFYPDWSIAFEYDHLFSGSQDITPAFAGNLLQTPGGFSTSSRVSQDVDIGTVRINYRWGGPVIAKY